MHKHSQSKVKLCKNDLYMYMYAKTKITMFTKF